MTKQELAHIARLMYELQEYCRYVDDMNNNEDCNGCAFLYDHVKCRLIRLTKDNKIPCDNWGITKADIERLEREGNEKTRPRNYASCYERDKIYMQTRTWGRVQGLSRKW